jgi:hypothetical protein
LLARESLQGAVNGFGRGIGFAVRFGLSPGWYHIECWVARKRDSRWSSMIRCSQCVHACTHPSASVPRKPGVRPYVGIEIEIEIYEAGLSCLSNQLDSTQRNAAGTLGHAICEEVESNTVAIHTIGPKIARTM